MTTIDAPLLSRVVFGSMSYPGRSQSQQLRVLQCAIDHGITSIDTAPLYDAGESERIVGLAIAGRRDSVQVLTKCGLRWDADYGEPMFSMQIAGQRCVVRKDSRPLTIAGGIDDSLRRLRIETIDLMQIHQLDAITPLDETLEALSSAKRAGKIRAIGVSNFPLEQIRDACSILEGSLYSSQEEFSMLNVARSQAIRDFAKEAKLAFLAYSPLAQGVLSGKYLKASRPADGRASSPFFRARNLTRINDVLERWARPLAEAHETSLAAVCLAWSLAQPGVTNVVVGASSERQCIENAVAMKLELPAIALTSLGEAMTSCNKHAAAAVTTLARRIARRAGRIRRRFFSR